MCSKQNISEILIEVIFENNCHLINHISHHAAGVLFIANFSICVEVFMFLEFDSTFAIFLVRIY